MSITVRVIFWGLMGFVPNEDGQKGLTALLVSPPHEEEECKHVPAAYLFEGECKGDCIQVAGHENEVATKLARDKTPKLRWFLGDQDLEIFGREKKVEFRERRRKRWFGFFGALVAAPLSARQATDYSWVPRLTTLNGGHGRIREECLGASNNCGLSARFTVRGGRASACHLFHDPELKPNPKDPNGREIVIFDFKYPGSDLILASQAVADAVQVEFEVEDDHVDLHSWGFAVDEGKRDSGKQGSDEHRKPLQELKAAARLFPAANSRTVTLIVANGPLPAHDSEGSDACSQSQAHSDILFKLLARGPVVPPQPIRNGTKRGLPGACEREVDAIATAILGEDDPLAAHSSTVCDGRAFQ